MRSTKTRPYRMRRRAEQVDETRLRITEAAVRLHTTVGPPTRSWPPRRGGAASLAHRLLPLCGPRHPLEAARPIGPPSPPPRCLSPLRGATAKGIQRALRLVRGAADDLSPIYRDMAAMPASAQREREAPNWRMVRRSWPVSSWAHPAAARWTDASSARLPATWSTSGRGLACRAGRPVNQDIVELAVRLLTVMARHQPRGPHEPPGRSGLDAA